VTRALIELHPRPARAPHPGWRRRAGRV